MAELALDLLLSISLILLAWRVLAGPDLFNSVVLFIGFGLIVSLTWVRLGAPDIALAEAAIGAGLTGALLLDAVGQMGEGSTARRPGARAGQLLAGVVVLGLAGVLLSTVATLESKAGGLTSEVVARMEESGVSHPVTGVLLNFRAYDTWLEVGVLLVAVLAALTLRRAHDLSSVPSASAADPVLDWLSRLLVPMMVLVGGYLLWLGTHAPGGAFQAGAVLAAAGVVLLLSGYRSIAGVEVRLLRFALVAGFGAFLFAAAGTTARTGQLLTFPPAAAGWVILLIELAVTVSIAFTLAALFAAARPVRPQEP